MGFFGNLFGKLKSFRGKDKEEEYAEDSEELLPVRSRLHVDDPEERRKFVEDCLSQMADATDVMEKLSSEYNLVTEYLTDMEELEALPKEERIPLNEDASRLVQLSGEQSQYARRTSQMSDPEFERMHRVEDEVEEAIRKLDKEEHMRDLIKKDLARLEGEKHAYQYRRKELRNTLGNARGMVTITICAMITCLFLLLFLQVGMDMDTKLGYILTVGIAATAITFVFLKFSDARDELYKVEVTMNRLILLQNKVKIRYVNNRNLLDYLYIKYGIKDGKELNALWEKYRVEKEERRQFEETKSDLSYYEKELVRKLNCYPIKYPRVWIHQPLALIDGKEMVEIRHTLITRRQSLRKQIDYNKKLAEDASAEIRDLAREYPKYAKEIQGIVNSYQA